MNRIDVLFAVGCFALAIALWARVELQRRRRARRRLAGRLQVEGPFRPNRRNDSSHIADSMLYARRHAAREHEISQAHHVAVPKMRPWERNSRVPVVFGNSKVVIDKATERQLHAAGVVTVPEGVRLVVHDECAGPCAIVDQVEPGVEVRFSGHDEDPNPITDVDGKRW